MAPTPIHPEEPRLDRRSLEIDENKIIKKPIGRLFHVILCFRVDRFRPVDSTTIIVRSRCPTSPTPGKSFASINSFAAQGGLEPPSQQSKSHSKIG